MYKDLFLPLFQKSADAARAEFQFAVIKAPIETFGDEEKTPQSSPEVFYQTGTKNPATVKSRGFCVQKRTYL